jgi:hypothetical protein
MIQQESEPDSPHNLPGARDAVVEEIDLLIDEFREIISDQPRSSQASLQMNSTENNHSPDSDDLFILSESIESIATHGRIAKKIHFQNRGSWIAAVKFILQKYLRANSNNSKLAALVELMKLPSSLQRGRGGRSANNRKQATRAQAACIENISNRPSDCTRSQSEARVANSARKPQKQKNVWNICRTGTFQRPHKFCRTNAALRICTASPANH